MTVSDLASTRFAYSPLAEVGESLYLLASGPVHGVHREWYRSIAAALARVDMELLLGVVTSPPLITEFLFAGAIDSATTIDAQLQHLCHLPFEDLVEDIEGVWRGTGRSPSPRLAELLAAGQGATRQLADVLFHYWTVAIEAHWPAMRKVYDEDVAYRAAELARRGMAVMLTGMSPNFAIRGNILITAKACKNPSEEILEGAGLLLVPSAFAWPNNSVFIRDRRMSPCLIYPARGVGNLWGKDHQALEDSDPLSALLGKSRAEILNALDDPACTTDLAARLSQSAAAVSQHLSVLRRTSLVTSWRTGRRVMYERTELAESIVGTNRVTANAG